MSNSDTCSIDDVVTCFQLTGHGVSPDLVRWTQLPVALWNGESAYDIHALFTGSATLVRASSSSSSSSTASPSLVPVLVFPGVCDMYPPSGTVPGCKYGYAFGAAAPANASDPFLTSWVKTGQAVVNDTFDDPSTAWATADGELRWIANCGDGTVGDCGPDPARASAPLYATAATTFNGDETPFAASHFVGFTNLRAGECSSLYPLPPLANGTLPAARMPTHVHKWGCEPYTDCVEIGWWREGKRGEVGAWTGLNGDGRSGSGYQAMDRGFAYAAKDVEGAPGGLRVSIAWARLNPSQQGQQLNNDVQTVARQVTYHPTLQQLLFYPVPALDSLRGPLLGSARGQTVTPGKPVSLGPWTEGNQSDVLVRVRVPSTPTTLYVSVTAEVRVEFYINFPGTAAAAAAAAAAGQGGDEAPWAEAEVGLLTADPYVSFKDTLRLLPTDKVLELRLLVDHAIVEAYWQGGRVAMTVPAPLTESTRIALTTDTAGASLAVDVDVWYVESAWIGKDEALSRASRQSI